MRARGGVFAQQAAVIFILITVTLDMLSLGLVVPVLPGLIVGFLHGDTGRGAEIYGLMTTGWALMQFFFSPMIGVMSDRFGRRSIVLLSNFGLGLDYLLMAWAPSIVWLFIGRLVSGITSASFGAANAYIADVTAPEKRAQAFGMVGAAFGVGFIIGPAVGGLLGNIDPRLPFWVAAGLSLTNAAYGYFVLPESLPPEKRSTRFNWKRANPVGSLGLLRSHLELVSLSAAHFLGSLAHHALPAVFVLYTTYRYGWDTKTVGLTLAAVGVATIIVQAGLIRPVVARLGQQRALLAGLSFGALGFAIYGLAPTGSIYWLGIPFMALWGLSGPTMQGLITQRVSAEEQGQLQGALASLVGIAGLIGPIIFTYTFAHFIDPATPVKFPGAPNLLASLLMLSAVLVVGLYLRHEKAMKAKT